MITLEEILKWEVEAREHISKPSDSADEWQQEEVNALADHYNNRIILLSESYKVVLKQLSAFRNINQDLELENKVLKEMLEKFK